MLGSIEELEKEIEQFRNNVAASNELQNLLTNILTNIQRETASFEEKSQSLIMKVENIPSAIESANSASNNRIKADVEAEMRNALQSFSDEQSQYIRSIEQTKLQFQNYVDQVQMMSKSFTDGVSVVLQKFDETLKKVSDENAKTNATIKSDVDRVLTERNLEFANEQEKYISSLQQTQTMIRECENNLVSKYTEFVGMLDRMNISDLYSQNVELKAELRKRTTILMIISFISIIAGILGIIF